MTSLERTLATIHHQVPDRVPVDLHNFLLAIDYAGLSMSEALQSAEMLAESQLIFWRDFQHDVLLVENGVVAAAGACGCEIDWPTHGPARVVGHPLADGLDKIDELEVPDPWSTSPMKENLEAVRILRQELGNQVYIMGRGDQAPGSLAGALRGYEQFIIDLALQEELDLIHRVLEYCAQVQVRYMLAMKEAGAHGTSMGEMGVDIIGPRLYRRFAHPYDCQVVEAVNELDFPVALHICGDATLILPEMISTGAQILELDYKTDKAVAKQALQGNTAFLGPVNPELLWEGTVAEVQDASLEAIEVLAPGGGFILGPGCALGHTTPPDNIHALIETAWKHGNYNPDGTLKQG